MTAYKKSAILFLFATLSVLYGCGVAHTKTDFQAKDMGLYKNILISEVKVYSNEAAAINNTPLQEKLKAWKIYSQEQLEKQLAASKYNLITSLDEADGETLLLTLDVNVRYGNRALRWAVGFGAGKGGVDSILTVKDAKTAQVKYKARADSDLAMSAAGGDIGSVLEENVRKLITQYSGIETSKNTTTQTKEAS